MGQSAEEYDQFFTIPIVAQLCVAKLTTLFNLNQFDVLFEPSFGAGAFLEAITLAGAPVDRIHYCDIDAVDVDHRFNFFEYPHLPKNCEHRISHTDKQASCLTIGNPPFGKNASTAIRFFNHAAKFSSVIALVLPRTFCKPSVQDRLDNQYNLIYKKKLPKYSFIFNGAAKAVPAVFQIWVHLRYPLPASLVGKMNVHSLRSRHLKLTHTPDFVFTSPASFDTAPPHIAIRRVGVNAGRIFTDSPSSCSKSSHMFLNLTDPASYTRVLETLRSLCLENVTCKFDTAGCPSISKSELCYLYIRTLQKTDDIQTAT
jgi:predicted RNA methylase